MLTEKQKAWDWLKAETRAVRWLSRDVPIGPRGQRPRKVTGHCPDCPHGWKHHSEAGNCRRGCTCRNGADR